MARSLDDVIADISESDDHHLYSSLAPLYKFIYDRHFDYEEQFSIVQDTVPDGTPSILEVGSGTGQLLALLSDEYGHVVGVDLNEEMVAFTREAAPAAEVITADMETVGLGMCFDVIVMLGRVFPHARTDEEGIGLLQNCYAHLCPGGVIVFNTFDIRGIEDEHVTEETFLSSDYSVTRTTEGFVTDFEAGHWEFTAEYTITNRATGETAVTEETMHLRAHTPSELEFYLDSIGFEDISFIREADFSLRAIASKSST